MKAVAMLGLAAVLMIGLVAAPVSAEEMTLNGSVMCAKCKLKKADAKECQDVLVVKSDQGATVEYYVAKNAVSKEFGHVCNGETAATVTGEVTEKDGKKWIAPSKMEKKG
jgi:hypothetical protein